MGNIHVVLADDHKIFMEGISSLLSNDESIEIIGQAVNSDELFYLLDNMTVHIIIMDIFLPRPLGIDVLKSILKKYSKIKVIVLSGNDEEVMISEAFSAGATGYLLKSVAKDELLEAIKAVNNGHQYIGRALFNEPVSELIKMIKNNSSCFNEKNLGLTDRENNIIRILSEGYSSKEVASQLNINTQTVEVQKNAILEKLYLKSTIELVKYAMKNKMIEL